MLEAFPEEDPDPEFESFEPEPEFDPELDMLLTLEQELDSLIKLQELELDPDDDPELEFESFEPEPDPEPEFELDPEDAELGQLGALG